MESYLDIKLSCFNSRFISVINCHRLSGSNVPVEAAEKSYTVPSIKGCYSVYMYAGKLGMHVPTYFDLPGNA